MYQAKGLLAAPRREGRAAFYNESHLARLGLIDQLQDRGFSLNGIKELLDGWDAGGSLPDLLGLRTWQAAAPLVLTFDELVARLGGMALSQDVVLRVIGLGLIEISGDKVIVPDARFLAVGADLLARGVPADAVLDNYEQLQSDAQAMAERFTDLFETHLWPDLQRRDSKSITTAVEALAPLAHAVVDAALAKALRLAADAFAAQHVASSVGPKRVVKKAKK